MKNAVLRFPRVGESRLYGYGGRLIDYTIERQLLDVETWTLLVNQFRLKVDGINGGWRGEYWGKMMRGASLTYRATKNEKLYRVMVDTVLDLLSTQDDSGSISTYTTDTEFDNWDIWSRKYVMLGLLYFLDVCKSRVLERKIVASLKRQANYIVKHVGAGRGKRSIFATSRHTGGLNSCSILEPFVKLYALCGEKKYFDFATYIVNTGFSLDANLIELCLSGGKYPYQFPQTKAYEMISCFEGLLEYYKLTGDERHLLAVENFADMVARTDYTIIGGCGCRHEFFDNSSLTQTEPPVQEVMQETCVTVTFMKLSAKLLALTGKAKYASYIERSGLNALYGAVNSQNQTMKRTQARTWVEGGRMVILEEHEAFPFDSYSPLFHGRRGYRVGGVQLLQNGRSYGCCVCIGSAGTALMGLFAVMKGEGGVYVNLYNDCRFKTGDLGEKVCVDIRANPYQCKGAKISVRGCGLTFALGLRIPAWAKNFSVTVNGEAVEGTEKDGYLVISRVWDNDKVKVSFQAPVVMSLLNGKIAFTKGPAVLARDCRFDDITKPVAITARNGKSVRARLIRNTLFHSNSAYEISTGDGLITLCDYAEAGKNYDDEHCNITVWQSLCE